MKPISIFLSLFLLIGFFSSGFSQNSTPDQGELEPTIVTFKLRNTSAQRINLRIPGVMNPTLSPFSDSGVSLKVGQKIFFYHKKKKQLLLEVSTEQQGEALNVPALIRERKRELEELTG